MTNEGFGELREAIAAGRWDDVFRTAVHDEGVASEYAFGHLIERFGADVGALAEDPLVAEEELSSAQRSALELLEPIATSARDLPDHLEMHELGGVYWGWDRQVAMCFGTTREEAIDMMQGWNTYYAADAAYLMRAIGVSDDEVASWLRYKGWQPQEDEVALAIELGIDTGVEH